jgi:leader peptidase (prepilin peptidase)/N-methyltransferase
VVGLGVLGAVFGSFIATYALRWPERSALAGRSSCDGCGKRLSAGELVPLVSWALLRGRCQACGGTIAGTHPLAEALGVAIGVTAALVAPGSHGLAGAVFGWQLLALGLVDARLMRLPNGLTAGLAVTGMVAGVLGAPPVLADRVIGGVAGLAVLWAIAAVYRRARGRVGLGGGDAKLLGAIGLWLGWRALAPVVLGASVLGLGWALARRMRADDRLPLGTLLAVAAFGWWVVSGFR